MANKPITEKSAGELVYGDGITLRYGADNGEGYPKECNLYNSLYFLAGEDVMKQVRQGKMSLSELENQIGLKYGQDLAKGMFKELEQMYETDGTKQEAAHAIKFEKLFLQCVKKDIDKLQFSKQFQSCEQIEEYVKSFRGFMLDNLPKVYDSNEEHDLTKDYFDIDELTEILIDRIMETNAFGISDRKVASVLLWISNDQIAEGPGYYYIYVPHNMDETAYKTDKKGNVVLAYTNESYGETRDVVVSVDPDTREAKDLDEKPDKMQTFESTQQQER